MGCRCEGKESLAILPSVFASIAHRKNIEDVGDEVFGKS
jgi:hypothetical protein